MEYKIFVWDWRETAPISAMLRYAKKINFKFEQEIEIDSDEEAHIIADTTLSDERIKQLWNDYDIETKL